MSGFSQFGVTLPEYEVPVLNEREVRAAAGLFCIIAGFAANRSWYTADCTATRIVVVAFFVDFILRLINPLFAPSLILGRLIVGNQRPEYVAAAPKRFAWSIGLGLASLMLYLVMFEDINGTMNLIVCGLCLLCMGLMFMEAAFGICVGCSIYNFFNAEKAKFCPGGVCEPGDRADIQKVSARQIATVSVFAVFIAVSGVVLAKNASAFERPKNAVRLAAELRRCTPSAAVMAAGQVEEWKARVHCR